MSDDAPTEEFASAIGYPRPFADYAVALARSAARQLCIQSPALDVRVFDNAELIDAIGELARGGRQTGVRILVADPRPLVQRGHRLLALARRLPSKVQIRVLAEHPEWQGETVVIRDSDGVLYHAGDAGEAAFYEPDSRASTQRHLERFEDLWRHSETHVELRSMPL